MKIAFRLLTAIFLTSTLASPIHALTYRQWQGITGLGAIGGALVGVMIYQAMAEKKREKHHPQDPLIIGHHNKPQKEKKSHSILASFCSGALGAATGALALGWWFWSKTPQARQEQAQELINLARANRFIAQEMDLANPEAVQNNVREIYPQNGEEFNKALWEMTTYEANLQAAQHLCAQAQADAQGDAQLQGALGNTQATVNDLLNRVTARAQAIRNNPAYLAQQVANAQRRLDQERIWREELERQRRRNAFGWRWQWQYEWPRRPYVEVVQVVQRPAPVHLPRPIVIQQPPIYVQPPVHLPRPVVVAQPQIHVQIPMPVHQPNHQPRPPQPHFAPARPPEIPYAAPPAPRAPTPAPLQRLIMQADARQRPQQPFHAHPAQARPMHPGHAFGRGNNRFRTL